ncbi:MAG: NAD-dependent epimerase/dehydratase family protein [Armatimonadetes bacterium]|nr:NAD-dependent epimerase/dehydratase family protein [Armatimonadota bacterium]
MLILVTGGTGFIGSHLVKRLVASGHQVRATVRETSSTSVIEGDGVEIRRGSLTDSRFVGDACADVDLIFNLAGRIGGPSTPTREMREANVVAVTTILKACRNGRLRQFIHCSTPGVVGMVGTAPECLPYRPAGAYERTKCEGERAALRYHQLGHVPVTVVRPDFVYGPGDMHKLKMFRAVKEGRLPIIGRGTSLLHPTYVDDVVDGMLLTMDNPAAHGEKFNLAGPEPVTVATLVGTIASELGVVPTRLRVPAPVLKIAALCSETVSRLTGTNPPITRYQVNFFTRSHASDISKARQMLGFDPRVSLAEGVKRTVQWYKTEGYL